MSTVYAVSAGCYSDYSILAVFSTRELAEQYAAWQNGPDGGSDSYYEASIEEWELDIPFTPTGAFVVDVVVPPHVDRWSGVPTWRADADPNQTPEIRWPNSYSKETRVTAYGPTKEHARRSADEMVRAILAGTVVDPSAGQSK